MRPKFNLSLGDRDISVFNWINWHGKLDGKNLRFIVPLESKSLLESNMDSTFTLVDRAGKEWDLELSSIEPQYTGTNGVKVVGVVAARAGAAAAKKPSTQSLEATPTTDPPEEGDTPASADPVETESAEKPNPFKKRPLTSSIPKPKALSEASEVEADEKDSADSEESTEEE